MGRGTPFNVSLSDFDWLPARINLDYNNENLAELPHLEHLRRLEGRIMMFVSDANTDGIGHLELARKIGINRKNLTPHMKRLMNKGLVLRGNGKRGKYYPANKKRRGVSITAEIFSKAAAWTILANEYIPINSPYFESGTIDNDSFDNALFKFSNRVGAIITYLIIQSMNPSNEVSGRDAKNAEEKDINVNRWFNDGISTLGPNLLVLFKEYMVGELALSNNKYVKEDGTFDHYKLTADYWRYLHTRPLFTLDEKSISSLVTSFQRTYPSIDGHLEKIRFRLPSIVNRRADWERYRRVRNKQQKICKHEFKPPRNTFLSVDFKGKKLLHCTKCHMTKSKKI
ncbi:MAG TPA: winged helix-turn-helix domain-containing protein [Nitrososphaeraceae archaeon]|jgi:DNA-binding MarR family transcriptional regulator